MFKILLVMCVMFSTTALYAADPEIYCSGKKVEVKKLIEEEANIGELIYVEDYCGLYDIEDRMCFLGKDKDVVSLINDYFQAAYEYDDETAYIGAYYKTGDNKTVDVKWKNTGDFKKEVMRKCTPEYFKKHQKNEQD